MGPVRRPVTDSPSTRRCPWGLRAEGDLRNSSLNRGVVLFAPAIGVVFGHPVPSAAEVDLEWRAASRLLHVGEVVEVSLYAV